MTIKAFSKVGPAAMENFMHKVTWDGVQPMNHGVVGSIARVLYALRLEDAEVGGLFEAPTLDDVDAEFDPLPSFDNAKKKRPMVFGYSINKDERGEFNASVRNENDKTVWETDGDVFEDGFMRHKHDLSGLLEYLIHLGIAKKGDRLVKESEQSDEIKEVEKEYADYDAVALDSVTFDALVVESRRLQRMCAVVQRVLTRYAEDAVKPTGFTVSAPRMYRGVVNVTAMFSLADGQKITIFFHNPDSTPRKLKPTDELISWKWLLNKKDVTIAVAPERGKDLDVQTVARRVMLLAERNTAAFASNQAKAKGYEGEITALKAEIAEKEVTLAGIEREIEAAKVAGPTPAAVAPPVAPETSIANTAPAQMTPPAESSSQHIASFAGAENTEVRVFKIDRGYSIGVYDLDAQETVPSLIIFENEAEAIAKAKEIAGVAPEPNVVAPTVADPPDADTAPPQMVPGAQGSEEFVPAPSGGIDFGSVPQVESKLFPGTVYPSAPVRLEVGGDYGKSHVSAERMAEFAAAGYPSESAFVDAVCKDLTGVYEQKNGRLLLVKRNGAAKYAVVELQKEGGYYGVTTMFLEDIGSKPYEERGGREKLWPVAQAAPSGKEAPFPTPAENTGAGVAGAEESDTNVLPSTTKSQDEPAPAIAAPEIVADPQRGIDLDYLTAVRDGKVDYNAPDILEKMTPIYERWESDTEMMEAFTAAVNAYQDFTTAAAQAVSA